MAEGRGKHADTRTGNGAATTLRHTLVLSGDTPVSERRRPGWSA